MENKIEKLNDKQISNVAGGYVGKDWSDKYKAAYWELGIKHQRNALSYDKYFFAGRKIPKKLAYAAADYLLSQFSNGWINMNGLNYIKGLFDGLESTINSGANDSVIENYINSMLNDLEKKSKYSKLRREPSYPSLL